MEGFISARKKTFDALSIIESVSILDKKELDKETKFKKFSEVWRVETEVSNLDGIGEPIILLIAFDQDFPVSIPNVYLVESGYNKLKYIPHVDTNYFICTYDKAVTVTNPDDPIGIVKSVLSRAKKIIEQGLAKSNFEDFQYEFLSYWENKYEEEPDVLTNILSLISESPLTIPVSLLILHKKLRGYNYILFQSTEEGKRFQNFLDEREIKYTESEVFYSDLDLVENIPPFHTSCRESIVKLKDSLGEDEYERFNKYINKNLSRKVILFRKNINQVDHYLGWFFPFAKVNRNGFRKGILSASKVYLTFQANDLVTRLSLQDFTDERIRIRAEGQQDPPSEKRLVIAGIGSIGSHLIHYLSSFKKVAFRLIDPDILTIENMARHFLGFGYVNSYKALAMKDYLVNSNPKLEVTAIANSIVNVYNENSNEINDSDYLFLVVGHQDVEEFIISKLKKGEIKVPVFIIWVEPYLAGGHVIYIHPNDFKYEEYYETSEGTTLFKYNIISKMEYIKDNPLLSLKEASCQSSYMPYSEMNVIRFLSQIFYSISKIIENNSSESVSMSWVGDVDTIIQFGIELSEVGKTNGTNMIVRH